MLAYIKPRHLPATLLTNNYPTAWSNDQGTEAKKERKKARVKISIIFNNAQFRKAWRDDAIIAISRPDKKKQSRNLDSCYHSSPSKNEEQNWFLIWQRKYHTDSHWKLTNILPKVFHQWQQLFSSNFSRIAFFGKRKGVGFQNFKKLMTHLQ